MEKLVNIKNVEALCDPLTPWGEEMLDALEKLPAEDVQAVKHGCWIREIGDSHSSGYLICCSECKKPHWVPYRSALSTLANCHCDEIFEEPKRCPNCAAIMKHS